MKESNIYTLSIKIFNLTPVMCGCYFNLKFVNVIVSYH